MAISGLVGFYSKLRSRSAESIYRKVPRAIGCARMASSFLSDVMLQSPLYIIDAFWDTEAGVWVATSDEVLGLATEAATIEQLSQKLHVMIPELIQANQLLPEEYQGTIA
jgi:predicted RNase H-like HicB family nuclease